MPGPEGGDHEALGQIKDFETLGLTEDMLEGLMPRLTSEERAELAIEIVSLEQAKGSRARRILDELEFDPEENN